MSSGGSSLDVPGSATVMVDGEIVSSAGDGLRQIVASVSKQFIAAAVLLAEVQGVVTLRDPVLQYVPELGSGYRDVALHHLLTHTAGVPHWTNEIPGLWISDTLTASGRIEVLARTPLLSAPGERWHYTSIGYALLVSVLERATGSAYDDLFHRWLAEPAELTATTVGPPTGAVPLARGHRAGIPVPLDELASTAGTGYVWSTAEDLARWTHHLHGGLLPAEHHVLLTSPHVEIPVDDDQHLAPAYGYGLFLGEIAGHRAWFHPGDNPGFCAFAGYLPDSAISIGVTSSDQDAAVPRLVDDIIRTRAAV